MKEFRSQIENVQISESGIEGCFDRKIQNPAILRTNLIWLMTLIIVLILSWIFLPPILSLTISSFIVPIGTVLIINVMKYQFSNKIILSWEHIQLLEIVNTNVSLQIRSGKSSNVLIISEVTESEFVELKRHLQSHI